MTFGCTSCGSCCKRVGQNLAKLKDMGFPYGVKEGTNTCEKLTDDGKCSVYETRPDICSIEKTYYAIHSKLGKTKKNVFLQEALICNSFIKEDGLDEKYLVNTTQYQ